MAALTIFCAYESARFRYVLQWIFNEVLHVTYAISDNEEVLKDKPFYISYGANRENSLSIPDTGLLWDTSIFQLYQKEIAIGNWKDIPTLFDQPAEEYSVPFDIFSAIFYLISRYEEYYPCQPDQYGRYPVSESILYKQDWLMRPLVDEWIFQLYLLLKENNIPVEFTPFQFCPTYDIDMAYSYKHKGLRRNIGGFTKSFLKGDFSSIKHRWRVLLSKELDPYDSFTFIKKMHTLASLKPIYFILAALKTTHYDKNISPENEEMQKLIIRLSKDGMIALHPSYFSDQGDVLHKEKIMLEGIIEDNITHSRQHYLRYTLPGNYRFLISQHILHDYSMGYGTKLGFRAGTGRSFLWYDLEKEVQTPLRVHPFCFMDTTARYEEKYSVEESLVKLDSLKTSLQNTSSNMITIFHNFSLGTDKKWKGWNKLYHSFISSIAEERKN